MARFPYGGAVAGDFTAIEPAFRTLVELPELQREHGGNLSAWARETGLDPRAITDLSASINPLGPPRSARKAFRESFETISRYPDGEGRELEEALARRHGLEAESVLLGNGSTQLIYLLCRALKPRRALVVQPAFSEYENALKLCGAEARSFLLLPEHEFRLPLQDFLAGLAGELDMIVLSNPNSATGRLIPRKEMEEIVRIASAREIFLVVDEAFIDFVEGESIKELVEEHPCLIVLRSLTKYYSLPGLRIGYLLAHPRMIELLGIHREPWSVNGPAQAVALACLEDREFMAKTSKWLERERGYLFRALAEISGIRLFPSQANFILAHLQSAPGSAVDLRRFLLQRRLLIRCCGSFQGLGENYFRVAVHRRKTGRILVQQVKAFLSSPASSSPARESGRG